MANKLRGGRSLADVLGAMIQYQITNASLPTLRIKRTICIFVGKVSRVDALAGVTQFAFSSTKMRPSYGRLVWKPSGDLAKPGQCQLYMST